ncbi:MAG: hypothetical protein EOM17_11380 [Synergistales bacterium]|nr:hypothetical protein [Synergistales bacterium]
MPSCSGGCLVLNPPSAPMILGAPQWDPLGDSSGTCREPGCGRTGWLKADYFFEMSGTFKLAFGVVNWSRLAYGGLSWEGSLAYTPPASDQCDFSWSGTTLDTDYQTGMAIDGVRIR